MRFGVNARASQIFFDPPLDVHPLVVLIDT